MFDDGTILFFSKLHYTLMTYTHELWFFLLDLQSIWTSPRYIKPTVGRCLWV